MLTILFAPKGVPVQDKRAFRQIVADRLRCLCSKLLKASSSDRAFGASVIKRYDEMGFFKNANEYRKKGYWNKGAIK